MIRNNDLAGMAFSQMQIAQRNVETSEVQPTVDARLISISILMAAHLIVDAIETASKES